MTFVSDNKILNDQEINEGKYILDSRPRRLIVTLSSRCNINCIMCEVRKAQWELPRKVIREVVTLFPWLESILWQGGEIFLLDYFEEIFDEASKFKNLSQTIVTNGLLITEEWAEKLVNNNVELVFSIDGVTEEVYEYIRKGAKFGDVLKGIKTINEAREKSHSENMSLRLHTVIMKSNYYQLEEFVDFAREYKFDAMHFIPIWGNLDSPENIFHQRDEEALEYIEKLRGAIEEKAKGYQIQLLDSLPSYGKQPDDEAGNTKISADELLCYLPWQQLNIDPGGGVRPGCLCSRTVGNILEDSLESLWNNKGMQMYRKKIIEKNYKFWCNPACFSGQMPIELRRS